MPDTIQSRDDAQIGKILVQNELISAEQLRECAELQKRVREVGGSILLGELLIQKGFIDEPTLTGALAVQREKLAHAIAPHPLREKGLTVEVDNSIGKIALQNGLIVQEQLDEALEIQKKVRSLGVEKRLGEILVDRGHVSRTAIEGLLTVQERRQRRATEQELKAIGAGDVPASYPALAAIPDAYVERTLSQSKLASPSLVAECREVQKKLAAMGVRKSLGEVLLSKGYITKDVAQRIVAQHGLERKGSDDEPSRPGIALRDIAAVVVMLALLAYVIFRDKHRDETPVQPPPGPAVVTGPGGGGVHPPPVVSVGGASPKTAVATLPPEELDRRAVQLLREATLAAFGALQEARLTFDAASAGKAFASDGKVRPTELQHWFEVWERRTLAILDHDKDLRERVRSGPRGAALSGLLDTVRTVASYGRARRGELASKLGLPPMSGPSATEDSETLRSRASIALNGIASAEGFDLPEEEEDPGKGD